MKKMNIHPVMTAIIILLAMVLASCASDPIPVTEIILDKTTVSLDKDQSVKLNATLSPDNADQGTTISWSSSHEDIASVSDGTVKALKPGKATITARTDNGKEASCVVTVNPVTASRIELNKDKTILQTGDEETLEVTFTPSDTEDRTITWSSSDPTVAAVENGKIKALKIGETMITARSSNGKEATCTVMVNPVVADAIALDKTVMNLVVNEEVTLTATIYPYSTTDKSVSWSSSDTSVATVDNGKVKAIAEGNTVITARTYNGKIAECTVQVEKEEIPVTSVSIEPARIVGFYAKRSKSAPLVVNIVPENATHDGIVWESSDEDVIMVSKGYLTSGKAGSAVVTATVGGRKAECKITVVWEIPGWIRGRTFRGTDGNTYSFGEDGLMKHLAESTITDIDYNKHIITYMNDNVVYMVRKNADETILIESEGMKVKAFPEIAAPAWLAGTIWDNTFHNPNIHMEFGVDSMPERIISRNEKNLVKTYVPIVEAASGNHVTISLYSRSSTEVKQHEKYHLAWDPANPVKLTLDHERSVLLISGVTEDFILYRIGFGPEWLKRMSLTYDLTSFEFDDRGVIISSSDTMISDVKHIYTTELTDDSVTFLLKSDKAKSKVVVEHVGENRFSIYEYYNGSETPDVTYSSEDLTDVQKREV